MSRIFDAGKRKGELTYPDSPRLLLIQFLKKSTNGVIWYILGVVFVLVFFPLDIAVVSILM